QAVGMLRATLGWSALTWVLAGVSELVVGALFISVLFFFAVAVSTEIYTLSLHDALPISSSENVCARRVGSVRNCIRVWAQDRARSEEHTSELQSRFDLVCRLLLEKKKQHLNQRDVDLQCALAYAQRRRQHLRHRGAARPP